MISPRSSKLVIRVSELCGGRIGIGIWPLSRTCYIERAISYGVQILTTSTSLRNDFKHFSTMSSTKYASARWRKK